MLTLGLACLPSRQLPHTASWNKVHSCSKCRLWQTVQGTHFRCPLIIRENQFPLQILHVTSWCWPQGLCTPVPSGQMVQGRHSRICVALNIHWPSWQTSGGWSWLLWCWVKKWIENYRKIIIENYCVGFIARNEQLCLWLLNIATTQV